MAIHPSFPTSPYEILNPEYRCEYLERTYPEFKDAILVIHTNNNGEVSESDAKKSKEELEKLRKASNQIDSWESPYKVIVSVLMLKEGWDVRNVTTIVGLRAYAAQSNILPEQTLGRGIRRMYPGIVFKDITTGEINHTTLLDSSAVTDYRSVIGYFTQVIMKDLRLVSGYDVLYGKVKDFVSLHLFDFTVDIDDLNTLRFKSYK